MTFFKLMTSISFTKGNRCEKPCKRPPKSGDHEDRCIGADVSPATDRN